MSESKNNHKNILESKNVKSDYPIISLQKILHDIRNLKSLTPDMISNIEDMNHQDKMSVILVCSQVIDYLKDNLENY